MSAEHSSHKYRQNRRKVPTILAALALTAGCSEIQNRVTPEPSPKTPVIDLTTMPEVLPQGVANNIGSVVGIDTQRRIKTSYASYVYRESHGTGVKVDGNYIVTAGHLFKDEENNKLKGFTCGDIYVIGKSTQVPDGSSLMGINQEVSSRTKGGSLPDVAIMTPAMNEYPSAPITDDLPDVGDDVYNISYQPTEKGESRRPDSQNIALKDPVILGGKVLGKNAILTGFQNYQGGDVNTRGGSSGSPVFTKEGEMYGIVTMKNANPYTIKHAEDEFGVEIANMPDDIQVGVAYVELTSKKLLKKREQELLSAPQCRPSAT